MKASTVVLLAVLVLIVALIIYAVAKDRGSDARRQRDSKPKKLWELYEKTDGTFDDAAQLVLDGVTAQANPTPTDHLLAATVLTRNVIDQPHRPEVDRAGQPTRAAREQTRQRRTAYEQARTHYMQALTDLGQPAVVPANFMQQDVLLHEAPARPERIIEEALGFAFQGFGALVGNDPLLAMLFAQGDWETVPQHLMMFQGVDGLFAVDTPLAEVAFQRQEDVVRERQKAATAVATEQGGAGGVAAEAYLELAKTNTSDSQNVHDPGVIACKKAVIQRLRADQGPLAGLPSVGAVIADLQQNGSKYSEGVEAGGRRVSRPGLVTDAILVAQETLKGERVEILDLSDEEALRRVWARADDPRNAAKRGELRQALFDTLIDCWEGGIIGRKIICVYGRVEKVLDSLVLHDWDKRNWMTKKVEQFKNDIYDCADKAIKAVALKATESEDPALQAAGRHFLTTSFAEQSAIEVTPAAAKQMRDDMRREVSRAVDQYLLKLETENGVKGGIPDHMVDKVKEEALAAIME